MKYYIKPWEHQRRAIEFANTTPNLALFWEMGTGKTATTINILRHRYQNAHSVMPTLILAPVVVLENWKEEFIAHAQIDEKFIVIAKGTGSKKIKSIEEAIRSGGQKIIITNYESMQNEKIVKLLTHFKPKIMVCDESQRLKSHKSKRAKAIAKLSDLCRHKYLLSGTPVLNSPMDIFMQFRILDGGETFGSNFYVFQKKYFEDKNAYVPHLKFPNWAPKPGVYAEFNRLISRKSLRALKKDCLDLPPLIKETINVELSPDQKRMYNELRNDFISFIEDETVVAQTALTKALRLQQVVSGFIKTDDGNIKRLDKSPRIKELQTLLADLTPTSKVIVWSCFKENYKQIIEVCDAIGVKYAQLHGSIKDKQKEIKAFRKDSDTRVMIANPQAAGLGVNLIEAGYSIYYSKNFSLESDLQSEARNHRGGSEKLHDKITRIDLVAKGTLDEQVTKALASKVDIATAILDWKL